MSRITGRWRCCGGSDGVDHVVVVVTIVLRLQCGSGGGGGGSDKVVMWQPECHVTVAAPQR